MNSVSWTTGIVTGGYGVASGRNRKKYPRGTIEMQTPFFLERGLDLRVYFPGTLNISIEPITWKPNAPWRHFNQVQWFTHHAPEDFSFFQCLLKSNSTVVEGLVYYPSPKTKEVHFHSASIIEVLAPWIDDLAVGDLVSVGVDSSEIEFLEPST
jgi:hypothetical protein